VNPLTTFPSPLSTFPDNPLTWRLSAPGAARATPKPNWSSRPYTDADRAAVLELFTEPDFFYRTAHPDTRAQWEILELVGADTRLLSANGALAGLYAVEPAGADHACHQQLHLRLRASAPDAWWPAAYTEIVRALRWNGELIRLAMQIGEFDPRGLRAARAIGLTEEGTLANLCVRGGRRHGFVFYSQIWEPS
jgi:hypothetical protein